MKEHECVAHRLDDDALEFAVDGAGEQGGEVGFVKDVSSPVPSPGRRVTDAGSDVGSDVVDVHA